MSPVAPDSCGRIVDAFQKAGKMQFHVENMTCGGCVRSITRALATVDADAKVSADLDARRIEVEGKLTREQVVAALERAGFEAS